MQVEPLSRVAVSNAEALADTFDEIVSDGVITPVEIAATKKMIRLVYVSTMESDDAQAAGISFMRTGIESQRSRRLVRQMEAGGYGPDAA